MKQKTHKTDVRLYIEDEYKNYLKLLAEEQGISVNRLIMDLVEKKYPLNKKAKERIENLSVLQDDSDNEEIVFNAPMEEREKQIARLREVNAILKKAYDGETLPNEEYRALKEEQAELRAILGHN